MADIESERSGNQWQSPDVQALIKRQNKELSEAGIVLKYLEALYRLVDLLEKNKAPSAAKVRKSAELNRTLVAGINVYIDEDGFPDYRQYVLVQVNSTDGWVDHNSDVSVGGVQGKHIEASPPFTREHLHLIQRHIREQERIGIEVSSAES